MIRIGTVECERVVNHRCLLNRMKVAVRTREISVSEEMRVRKISCGGISCLQRQPAASSLTPSQMTYVRPSLRVSRPAGVFGLFPVLVPNSVMRHNQESRGKAVSHDSFTMMIGLGVCHQM